MALDRTQKLVIGIGGFLAMTTTCAVISSNRDEAAKIEQQKAHDAEIQKHMADRAAKFKGMSPSEHLAAMEQIMSPKDGNLRPATGPVHEHFKSIPADAPEHKAAQALEKKAVALDQKVLVAKKAQEAKTEAATKAAIRKELAQMKKKGVNIGMTRERVLLSSWGRPEHINTTTLSNGSVQEQWVYSGYHNYLYFQDGVLVTIQN